MEFILGSHKWNKIFLPTKFKGYDYDHKDEEFEKIPDIQYLYALNKRNNFYIESHHPLRETIINQTGKLQEDRRQFLQRMFDDAVNNIPVKWKPKERYGERL